MDSNVIYLKETLVKSNVPECFKALMQEVEAQSDIHAEIFIDGSMLVEIDSAGVALIDEILEKCNLSHANLINFSDSNLEKIKIFSSQGLTDEPLPQKESWLYIIGEKLLEYFNRLFDMTLLMSEIFYWSIVGIWDKKGHRKGSFTQQCFLIGMNALPIVGLLSFIIGFILSLQSAVLLRNFGADIFLAELLAHSLVRELSPLFTAIIVAGRSGSAIAAEIATMKVTEELDALKMMALNPIRYVVVPKFHAVTVCMALLVTFSIIVGIFGGVLVAVTVLDFSVTAFLSTCVRVISARAFSLTLIKSTVFAWQIVIIGSYYGFSVRGGAEDVGRVTTQAVVASIFGVIIMDAIFSLQYLI